MRANRSGEAQLPAQRAGGVGAECEQDDDDKGGDTPSLQEAPEGQVEDVEADVPLEVRVDGPEVAAVQEEEHRLPIAAPGRRRDEPDEHHHRCQHERHRPADVRQLQRADAPDGDLGGDPARQPDAEQGGHREGNEPDPEQSDLHPQPRGQYVLPAQGAVPHEVGDQVHDAAQEAEDHDGDDGDADPQPPARRAAGAPRPQHRRAARPERRLVVGGLVVSLVVPVAVGAPRA